MILADSSILIEMGRKPTLPVTRVVLSGRPAVCGVTVAEMFAGVQTEAQRRNLDGTLGLFRQVPMDRPVWELTGRISGRMARLGKKVKFQDSAIAATAIQHRIPLWTRDTHFTWIQSAFPELRLFDESSA